MDISDVAADPRVAAALAFVDASDAETIADMEAATRIAAPTGAEDKRGAWFAARLAAVGLDVAPPDAVGNILAVREGVAPAIVLASHLDTVFAAETDLTITHRDARIHAPGISDNGRGLAALIRVASALHAADVRTRHAIRFCGTVGEEGRGDLRGVKHLFSSASGRDEIGAFIAVDGAGTSRIVHRAVGSRRLRVTMRGPGGHSWIDRGTAHPMHALSTAIAAVSSPASPSSSFSVGRIDGGTGINVIPSHVHADIDIRSEDGDEIARIETALRAAVASSVTRTNDARRAGSAPLECEIVVIGDRPGGMTPADAHVVRCGWEATRHCGVTPELISSSTDANVPMSLGVPAIAIGAGGDAGGMHTTDEWYDNNGGPLGIRRLLLLVVLLAGLEHA